MRYGSLGVFLPGKVETPGPTPAQPLLPAPKIAFESKDNAAVHFLSVAAVIRADTKISAYSSGQASRNR
jgi:hypothetical protein